MEWCLINWENIWGSGASDSRQSGWNWSSCCQVIDISYFTDFAKKIFMPALKLCITQNAIEDNDSLHQGYITLSSRHQLSLTFFLLQEIFFLYSYIISYIILSTPLKSRVELPMHLADSFDFINNKKRCKSALLWYGYLTKRFLVYNHLFRSFI